MKMGLPKWWSLLTSGRYSVVVVCLGFTVLEIFKIQKFASLIDTSDKQLDNFLKISHLDLLFEKM